MMFKRFSLSKQINTGFILPGVLAFIIAMTIVGGAILTVVLDNFFVVGNNAQSQEAFNIAEAGINYYLWHMAYDGTDFKDGQSTPTTPNPTLGYGPYVLQYKNINNVDIGTYTLWINPQGGGSTIATVRSIGQVNGSPITRTIQAQIGAASFASYGLVSNTAAWFGNDEAADGPVFDNQGIRMDGPSDDVVENANATYVPSTQLGGNGSTTEPGVWCSSTVTSPVNCNTRNKTDWIYPEPAVDFGDVSTSLCTMKKTALANYSTTSSYATMSNACSQLPTTRTNAYIPERSTSFSYSVGYLIQLNPSGTYNLYDVNADNDQLTPYTSALTLQSVATNLAIPSSGVIFVEDNAWVITNPTFTGRVTIASGRLASTSQTTNITIAGNVLYGAKNGSDAIGMVSEGNVYIAPYAPPATGNFNFEVDGALLAGNGSVTYPYTYQNNSNVCTRGWTSPNQTLTFYGSVASDSTWTWNWQGGACGNMVYDPTSGNYFAGIENTSTDYDYNLLYAPPPGYPLTTGYNILSWREVLTKP
jgi:Tfp pilus assembly protein PilX